jgi:hypothetical protein
MKLIRYYYSGHVGCGSERVLAWSELEWITVCVAFGINRCLIVDTIKHNSTIAYVIPLDHKRGHKTLLRWTAYEERDSNESALSTLISLCPLPLLSLLLRS